MTADIYDNRFAGLQPAWHRLGVGLPEGATAQEAMDAARLSGWNIGLRKVDDNLYAIVRTEADGRGRVISDQLVEGSYVPVQNEDVFVRMMETLAGTRLKADAAGALGRFGHRAFITFRGPDMEVPGSERYQSYALAIANHSGRDSVVLLRTAIRVVCSNTEQQALSTASRIIRIPHNITAIDRFYEETDVARSVLDLGDSYERSLAAMAAELQSEPVNILTWRRAMDSWAGAQRAVAKTDMQRSNIDRSLANLWEAWVYEIENVERLQQDDISLWTAKQALSTYGQHMARGSADWKAKRAFNIAEGRPVHVIEEPTRFFAREYAMQVKGDEQKLRRLGLFARSYA